MSNRSPARAPLPESPLPRGRTGMTVIGSLLVAGGVAIAALISQGFNGNASTSTASGSSTALSPLGTPPANFKTYRAPGDSFALYISNSWKSAATTVTWNGQKVPATTFTPDTGSKVPAWTIAILTVPVATDNANNAYYDGFGNLLETRDGAAYTPQNGPTSKTIGTQLWTEQNGTYNRSGQDFNVTAYTLPYKTGTVLVFYEDLPNLFSGSEQENFLPMLNSLNLGT